MRTEGGSARSRREGIGNRNSKGTHGSIEGVLYQLMLRAYSELWTQELLLVSGGHMRY